MRMRREFMKIVSVAFCSLIVAAFFILNMQFSHKKRISGSAHYSTSNKGFISRITHIPLRRTLRSTIRRCDPSQNNSRNMKCSTIPAANLFRIAYWRKVYCSVNIHIGIEIPLSHSCEHSFISISPLIQLYLRFPLPPSPSLSPSPSPPQSSSPSLSPSLSQWRNIIQIGEAHRTLRRAFPTLKEIVLRGTEIHFLDENSMLKR